jgi:hypothetical protein
MKYFGRGILELAYSARKARSILSLYFYAINVYQRDKGSGPNHDIGGIEIPHDMTPLVHDCHRRSEVRRDPEGLTATDQ